MHAMWVQGTELCSPQIHRVEFLTPTEVVFKDGAFGRLSGLDEIMRMGAPIMRLLSL